MIEPARSTRPHPDEPFGDTPASDGLYCPSSSTARLMRSALIREAGGFGIPFLTSVSRNTAVHPVVSGVAMLVPASKKNVVSDEVPNTVGTLTAARDRVDRIEVPGATTSGFMRPSLVGPRLLNAA